MSGPTSPTHGDPVDSWVANEDAAAHVKRLLIEAGLPLEAHATSRCRSFVSANLTSSGPVISTQRVTYGDVEGEGALREVDQVVGFYSELELPEPVGVQLHLQVPIECKHRDGLTIFGYAEGFVGTRAIPIVSDLVGSELLRQIDQIPPSILERTQLCQLATLKIEGGAKPVGVIEENLIYKAGASLYDFIASEVVEAEHWTGSDARLDELGILDEWGRTGHTDDVTWLSDRADLVSAYNEDVYGPLERMFDMVSIHLPVVCVDASLYEVTIERDGGLGSFSPRRLLACAIRTPNWSRRALSTAARFTPESLVVIVNVRYLKWFLEGVLEWYRKLGETLRDSEPAVVQRAPLEASIARESVLRRRSRTYRSDLGFI